MPFKGRVRGPLPPQAKKKKQKSKKKSNGSANHPDPDEVRQQKQNIAKVSAAKSLEEFFGHVEDILRYIFDFGYPKPETDKKPPKLKQSKKAVKKRKKHKKRMEHLYGKDWDVVPPPVYKPYAEVAIAALQRCAVLASAEQQDITDRSGAFDSVSVLEEFKWHFHDCSQYVYAMCAAIAKAVDQDGTPWTWLHRDAATGVAKSLMMLAEMTNEDRPYIDTSERDVQVRPIQTTSCSHLW